MRILLPSLNDLFSPSWSDERNERKCRINVDISETNKAYIIDAELPGIKEEDIDIKLNDHDLTVKAEKENTKKDVDYKRKEISKGKFERHFRFPDNINTEDISANLKNGILEINIPKKEDQEISKTININKK